jgi:hypothetical protein
MSMGCRLNVEINRLRGSNLPTEALEVRLLIAVRVMNLDHKRRFEEHKGRVGMSR